MKKYSIYLFVTMILTVFCVTASAVESQFNGSLRTRWFTEKDWSGNEIDKRERTLVDMRSDLTYTAKIHDNLKFVSDFRIDAVWGGGGGDNPSNFGVGMKPKELMIRQLYMDFSFLNANFKIGHQDFYEARGMLIYDAAPALNVNYDLNDMLSMNFIWMKTAEGSRDENIDNDQDLDFYMISPKIKLNKNITFKPYLYYATANELHANDGTWDWWFRDSNIFDDFDLVYLGFDADATFGPVSAWFTAIYQTGTGDVDKETQADLYNDIKDYSFSGFAALGGGSIDLGKISIAGQLFYASGDDDLNDDTISYFIPGEGAYYYWSEIMGLGHCDDYIVYNMNWALTNIVGAGGVVTVAPIDKLTLDLSLWYAAAVEDFRSEKDPTKIVEAAAYGTELNAIASYELMDNLKLTLIGAYVFAGDAITEDRDDNANPYTLMTQLKLSF